MTENRRAAYATLEQRLNCSYRTLYAGIFLIALATLHFEVSLIRVFSFTIWHHFGYVVISTALLGFAASGTDSGKC